MANLDKLLAKKLTKKNVIAAVIAAVDDPVITGDLEFVKSEGFYYFFGRAAASFDECNTFLTEFNHPNVNIGRFVDWYLDKIKEWEKCHDRKMGEWIASVEWNIDADSEVSQPKVIDLSGRTY